MRHQESTTPLVPGASTRKRKNRNKKKTNGQTSSEKQSNGTGVLRSGVEDHSRNFAIADSRTGVAVGPQEGDRYKGYGCLISDPEAAERRNVELLKRLASEINETRILDSVAENKAIPAGYTYFSQFVTHDLAHNVASLPGTLTEGGYRPNLRALPLMLTTMYGGGPGVNPLCYEVGGRKGRFRTKMRLGQARETGEHVVYQDLPRDRLMAERDCNVSGATCPVGMPDVMIADIRNDDTPMLAQIQVLFYLLHNRLVDEQEQRYGTSDFATISRVVAYLYRKIIREDLMKRLLHGAVYDAYRDKTGGFIDSDTDLRVPVEFSNSALRIGHVMVRNEYTFNKHLKRPIDLVLLNTSYHSFKMPMQGDWIINWAKFFDLDGTYQGSRKIGPWVASLLAGASFPDPDGSEFSNIMERDLLRGLFAEQWSVPRLISKLADHLPEGIARYELMGEDDACRKQHIAHWLASHCNHLDVDDARMIKDDPPLFFYILLEASLPKSEGGGDGEHLGILGSLLIAETMFKTLSATEHLVDAPGAPATAETAAELLSGEVPASMPELIRLVPLWDVDAFCPV